MATEFCLEMSSTDGKCTEVYRGPSLDCTLTSLLPGASYRFRVRGANKAGVRNVAVLSRLNLALILVISRSWGI